MTQRQEVGGTGGSSRSLAGCYDVLLVDLDGTVYRGAQAIPGAADALSACAASVLFVTNNAARSPDAVVAQLSGLGIEAAPDRVVTSAQAGARALRSWVDVGEPVLVVGAAALEHEVRAQGFVPVRRYEEGVRAVVQGFSPDVGWRDLAEASLVLGNGGAWVATNTDTTLPSERGLLPGNGSLVSVLTTATGSVPSVAGKPGRRIFDDAVRVSGARRPLAVGDRISTDIAGAAAAGIDSLLVLTGVSSKADLIRAPRGARPTYAASCLGDLAAEPDAVRIAPHPDWDVQVSGGVLRARYAGPLPIDSEPGPGGWASAAFADRALRAVSAAAWKADFDGEVLGADPISRELAGQWNGR